MIADQPKPPPGLPLTFNIPAYWKPGADCLCRQML